MKGDLECYIIYQTIFLSQLQLPVMVAPMFLVSGTDLVIEACKSGVIGSFPLANARTVEDLELWMTAVTNELAKA